MIGYQQLTANTNDSERHVHFSDGGTPGTHHNPQQALSGLVLTLEYSNTEKAIAPAANRRHNNSKLHLKRCGSSAQLSDVRTRLDTERAIVSVHEPPDQPPEHDYRASARAPAPIHQTADRLFVEDSARVIIAQLSSLLLENQPRSRTNTRETVHHTNPIDGKRTIEASAVNDTELRESEQGRPWELCEICKKKPYLVTEKRIRFCHSCYGEAIAAEKALSRRRMLRDRS